MRCTLHLRCRNALGAPRGAQGASVGQGDLARLLARVVTRHAHRAGHRQEDRQHAKRRADHAKGQRPHHLARVQYRRTQAKRLAGAARRRHRVQDVHDVRLGAAQRESEHECQAAHEPEVRHERVDQICHRAHGQRQADDPPFGKVARHHRHGHADRQRGDRERTEHPADRRRRQADMRALDRNQERVEIPRGRKHGAGDEHRTQLGVLQQIQRRPARAVLDGDPACVAALRRQARTHVLQASLADQRDDHQHAECRTVSGVLDHIAHRHGTQRARDGQAQCVQRVVAQAGFVGRYLTD